MAVLSVTQLNRYVGYRLKEERALQNVLVRGEITNFTAYYRSGHLYFTLKDAEACVKAVMFRGSAQRLRFQPADGMRVIVAASAVLYEKEGSFQLNVTDMILLMLEKHKLVVEAAGAVSLAALEHLKKKLTDQGVFDVAAKRPIPVMPQRIGVITSDVGAALQDVRNVISRRYPVGHLLVYPAQVQGNAAVQSICSAIAAAQADRCDVLIVGRGGGSAENLQAFNTEQVVMAIYHCTIPIVSAVGHETDWTLADAAADLRAPTPSAAAELAVPDMRQLLQQIQEQRRRMTAAIRGQLQSRQQELERLCDRLRLQSPAHRQSMEQQALEHLYRRLVRGGAAVLERYENQLRQQAEKLEMLSPLKILGRGYALVYQGEELVRRAEQVQPGDILRVQLAEGEITAEVKA